MFIELALRKYLPLHQTPEVAVPHGGKWVHELTICVVNFLLNYFSQAERPNLWDVLVHLKRCQTRTAGKTK